MATLIKPGDGRADNFQAQSSAQNRSLYELVRKDNENALLPAIYESPKQIDYRALSKRCFFVLIS